jgi:hypothetical protein
MILSELTAYLAEQKRATLLDLSILFGSDPEALRGMLAILEGKGPVRNYLCILRRAFARFGEAARGA